MRSSDCFVELTGNHLSAGNERFRRTWRVGASGLLYAESFRDVAGGMDWLVWAGIRRASRRCVR